MSDSMYVGVFWCVYDQIFGIREVFDEGEVVNDGRYIKIPGTHEDYWERVRKSNNLPNKPWDYYTHGEVKYDTQKYKFEVSGTPKMLVDESIQKRIIRNYKLPKFVTFKEYEI